MNQNDSGQRPWTRYGQLHGQKSQLLGSRAQPHPAWRTNNIPGSSGTNSSKGKEVAGSKIFISSLPYDVGEKEVEELFRKTVGPLKDVFIVYNSQGKSKGMAVVHFTRPGDAAVARSKYHGKVVDARRPIQIELLVDNIQTTTVLQPINPPNTLLSRIAPGPPLPVAPTHHPLPPVQPIRNNLAQRVAPVARAAPSLLPPRRARIKKGPKRLNKRHVTVEDLDQEMEEYRAAAIDS